MPPVIAEIILRELPRVKVIGVEMGAYYHTARDHAEFVKAMPNITLQGRGDSAVTLTGTPLGLTTVKFWTRTKFKGTLALKRHINPRRVPI